MRQAKPHHYPPETMFVYWLPLPYIALANRCVDRCPQQTPIQVVYRWSQQIYDVDVLVYLVEVSTATKQPEEPARVLNACANNVNMQRWGAERAFFVSAPLTASINNFLRSQKDPLPLPLLTYSLFRLLLSPGPPTSVTSRLSGMATLASRLTQGGARERLLSRWLKKGRHRSTKLS